MCDFMDGIFSVWLELFPDNSTTEDYMFLSYTELIKVTDLPSELIKLIDEYYRDDVHLDNHDKIEFIININIAKYPSLPEEDVYYSKCLMYIYYYDTLCDWNDYFDIGLGKKGWINNKQTVYSLAYLCYVVTYYRLTFIPYAQDRLNLKNKNGYPTCYIDNLKDDFWDLLSSSHHDPDSDTDEITIGCALQDSWYWDTGYSHAHGFYMDPQVLKTAITKSGPGDLFKELTPESLGIRYRELRVYRA
jgi:hypothetical protein